MAGPYERESEAHGEPDALRENPPVFPKSMH